MGGGADFSGVGEVGQEFVDVNFAERFGGLILVEFEVFANPIGVGFVGLERVMACDDRFFEGDKDVDVYEGRARKIVEILYSMICIEILGVRVGVCVWV